jgi:hypothetical protein
MDEYSMRWMGVSGAAGETAERQEVMRQEDVYRIVRQAVESRRPICAVYHERPRLFCPHRLGRNKEGQRRVLCCQFGGESESGLKPAGSPDNWRCIALDKLSGVALAEGAWRTAPNHSRPASCIVEADVDADDDPERGLC